MKKLLYLFLTVLIYSNSWAKEAYNIKVKINGLPNAPIKLAYYYGDKQYVKQEAATDNNGEVVFKGDTALPSGIYMVVTENSNYFEFLVVEQVFSIVTDYNAETDKTSTTFTETLKATKSPQNTAFFEHNLFIKQKKEEADALKKLLEIYKNNPSKKAEAEDINKKLKELDKEVTDKQTIIIKTFKGKLLSKLLLAAKRPEIPLEITDQTEKYNYYRSHFWDDFDFSFTGLLYSPYYQQRVKEYLENLTVQHYDSVFASCDFIIGLSAKNKEFFKYNLVWMLNAYAKSTTVCFDAVYVRIAQKYYTTGQADWVEAENLKKIIDNANALSASLCGQKAPQIKAKTETYATPSLHSVKAKYTALLLWDADCYTCKKEAKELVKIYADYKDKGFNVYSIDLGTDKEKWEKFSAEESIPWINLQLASISSDVRKDYDVKTTPSIFLLDENKVILYKRIDTKNLVKILDYLFTK